MDPNAGLEMTDSGALQPRKRPRSPSYSSDEEAEALYPPEIWEAIFRHLTGVQLLRMRLVCRRWRDIITGCPPLMGQYKIRLENMTDVDEYGDRLKVFEHIDENFEPDGLLPVTELLIKDYPIEVVGSWWSCVVQKLKVLTLNNCEMEIALLFSMLNQTPNLRCLRLIRIVLEGNLAYSGDIRLEKLQSLSLSAVLFDNDEERDIFLSDLNEMFPRLRDLLIGNMRIDDPDTGKILKQSLRNLQGTLEGFDLDKPVVNVAMDLPELHLKRVPIHVDSGFDWKCWSKFFRTQPQIEDLVIYISHVNYYQILSDIGQAVPQLKRFTLYLKLDYNLSENVQAGFLKFMPNLEFLEMSRKMERFSMYKVLFSDGNPRLKELCLEEITINSGFVQYIAQSPQIRSVMMKDSIVENDAPVDVTLSKLTVFEFVECSCIRVNLLKILFELCPFLEVVNFAYEDMYTDEVVLLACERLKRLRKLAFEWCSVTDASVDHIVRYGLALEEFKVGRNYLTPEGIKQIEATRNIRVVITKL